MNQIVYIQNTLLYMQLRERNIEKIDFDKYRILKKKSLVRSNNTVFNPWSVPTDTVFG